LLNAAELLLAGRIVAALVYAALAVATGAALLERRGASVAALAALLLSAAAMVTQAALLADLPDAFQPTELAAALGAALPVLLLHSHAGLAWWSGMAALLAAALLLRLEWWRRGLAALALFLLSRAVVSHAAGDGDVSWAVVLQWLHLGGACAWAGVVLVGAMRSADAIAQYAQRLSRVATVALALVLGSAVLRLLMMAATMHLTDAYLTVLAAKIALVAAAAALGAFNRFICLPALGQGGTAGRRFLRVLRIEAAVMLAVLLAAAVLGSTSPI